MRNQSLSRAGTVMGTELAQVLRSGPFDLALRTAIREQGLSLEAIQRRLARRGIQVSVSSLSYWQRGRSRPERAASLDAVRALEEVLELERHSLIVLLGPRRPRGRWIDHIPGSLDHRRTFGDQAVERVLADLDPRANTRVETLHTRIDVHIGPEREERRVDVLQIVRALDRGADRLVLVTRAGPQTSADADLFGLVGCRLGRRRIDREHGVTAAELLFDLPIPPGGSTIVEYSYAYPSSHVATEYERKVGVPGRNLALRVNFDAGMLPAGCTAAWRPHHDAPARTLQEVRISSTGQACLVVPDVAPGVHGLYWEWDGTSADRLVRPNLPMSAGS
ncbi:helix-turn-helix transcriptional regulator [Kitasatospora cystarginea]